MIIIKIFYHLLMKKHYKEIGNIDRINYDIKTISFKENENNVNEIIKKKENEFYNNNNSNYSSQEFKKWKKKKKLMI